VVDLGTFSVSLSVQDLETSRAFYEAMGFEVIDGTPEQGWLILRNGEARLGLFQGMFDENVLTFNPADVRDVQRAMKERGIEFVVEVDEGGRGPGYATLLDPDDNPILLDQH
jgi:catechol 2,3-dioxygenase-like lactoylglutathione lyase family enzyme